MVQFSDNFNRSGNAYGDGLGTIPNGPVWEQVFGSWRIRDGQPETSTNRDQNPIAAAEFGNPNVDITLDVGRAGDAIYFRIVDASNWLRARVESWTTTEETPIYETEYEWYIVYGGEGTLDHTHSGLDAYVWSFSNSSPDPSDTSITHEHEVAEVTDFHEHASTSESLTGNTREVQTGTDTTTNYHYSVHLEECVTGTITELGSATTDLPNSLRAKVDGNAVSVYIDNTLEISSSVATHDTATKHGIGRGQSTRDYPDLDNFFITVANTPPDVPTLVFPIGNESINQTQQQQFEWDFNDPDPDDQQSAYDLRYRETTTTVWTVISGDTQNTYVIIAANTFENKNYEWQVRTTDASGAIGPYSPSEYFSGVIPPDAPTITSHANGGTVSSTEDEIVWNTAEQQSYQIRRVADDGTGSPDTATIYYDSGEVQSSTTRSHVLSFPVNDRDEHIQIRVMKSDIWSDWASIRITVSYIPPPSPTITLTREDEFGYIQVNITNPPPDTGVGEPEVAYNEVYRKLDGEYPWVLMATNVGVNNIWQDHEAASSIRYSYKVRAIGVNDTQSESESVKGSIVLADWWLKDIDTETYIRIDVEQQVFSTSAKKDISFYNPIGRSNRVAIEDVVRGEDFSLTISTVGPKDYETVKSLLHSQRTLLVQAAVVSEQWYVRTNTPIDRDIINLVDPYVNFKPKFTEVSRPPVLD